MSDRIRRWMWIGAAIFLALAAAGFDPAREIDRGQEQR